MKLHQRGWETAQGEKMYHAPSWRFEIKFSAAMRVILCACHPLLWGKAVESLRLAHQPSNSRFLRYCVISQSSGWDPPLAQPDTRWGESAKIQVTGHHGDFYIGLRNDGFVANFRFVRITTYLWLTGLSWTWVPQSHCLTSKTTWWTSPPPSFSTYCHSWNGLLQSTTAPNRVATGD